MCVNLRDARLAMPAQELTQRVLMAQKKKPGVLRVARELHRRDPPDSVGVRYAIDNARRRLERAGHPRSKPLARDRTLPKPSQEVRRSAVSYVQILML